MLKNLTAYLALLSLLSSCQSTNDTSVSYNRDIRPIFNQKCLSCHGGVKQSGGFSLLFEEDAFAATESGKPAIVPGQSTKSELVRRLRHTDPELRMPYQADPLNEAEIQLVERWIKEGAKWEKHWAYIPPDPGIEPPEVKEDTWANNDIDRFILARLERESLTPNQEADRAVLLRRLSLDLIGLPPSMKEVDNFVNDAAPDAYERQVDRLLASSHFGERWAGMWLDLARYADSKGYEKDLYRSIWKFRDWVIRAFNEDKPFDEFTIEQLAGDLLPDPTQDQLVATAFHRNTMANDEGGTDNEEFRNYANIERVGTTFEVWQSTTMACVQCHSHPYDPFRQEDFYEFMAFFNNTADRDIYHEAPNLFTYEGPDKGKVEEIISWIEDHLKAEDRFTPAGTLHQQKEALLEHLGYRRIQAEFFDKSSAFIELIAPDQNALFQIQDTSWIRFDQVDLSRVANISFRYASPFGGYVEARLNSQFGPLIGNLYLPPTAPPSDPERWAKWQTRSMDIESTTGPQNLFFVFKKDKIADADLLRLDWWQLNEVPNRKDAYNATFNQQLEALWEIQPTPTPIMQELPLGKRRTTHIFERGNWLVKGREVHENIPEILGQLPEGTPANRLAMARWLVSPENPLTARVAVNRFWEQLFGYGIVETVEDMGTQSKPPSHPELLDWLAVQFSGDWHWSVKQLLRTLVTSSAYRQSTEVNAAKLEKDPRNLLLSRGPRLRLSAEQLRDQILAVSDLINLEMYGPSAKPPYPKGAGQFKFGDRYEVSDSAGQHRRAVYTYLKRTNPFPNRINFDGTDRTFCTSRRIRTNTPLQALALLNDPAYMEAAQALAQFMQAQPSLSDLDRLKAGYQRVMLHPPDERKVKILKKLYDEALAQYGPDQQSAAFALVANALLNLDEFINS
ncbi:MAG: DUF1549 domain-containing protein [Lewinella sp.]|nr:DUF1549 domain-containing protein [Lewinella sp.]